VGAALAGERHDPLLAQPLLEVPRLERIDKPQRRRRWPAIGRQNAEAILQRLDRDVGRGRLKELRKSHLVVARVVAVWKAGVGPSAKHRHKLTETQGRGPPIRFDDTQLGQSRDGDLRQSAQMSALRGRRMRMT
jgi:hypothetical protein